MDNSNFWTSHSPLTGNSGIAAPFASRLNNQLSSEIGIANVALDTRDKQSAVANLAMQLDFAPHSMILRAARAILLGDLGCWQEAEFEARRAFDQMQTHAPDDGIGGDEFVTHAYLVSMIKNGRLREADPYLDIALEQYASGLPIQYAAALYLRYNATRATWPSRAYWRYQAPIEVMEELAEQVDTPEPTGLERRLVEDLVSLQNRLAWHEIGRHPSASYNHARAAYFLRKFRHLQNKSDVLNLEAARHTLRDPLFKMARDLPGSFDLAKAIRTNQNTQGAYKLMTSMIGHELKAPPVTGPAVKKRHLLFCILSYRLYGPDAPFMQALGSHAPHGEWLLDHLDRQVMPIHHEPPDAGLKRTLSTDPKRPVAMIKDLPGIAYSDLV